MAPSQAREQELVKSKKKSKNQVRKLLTGKRPVASSTTEAPTTTTTVTYNYNRYNTVQRNRPTTTTSSTENYPSSAVPAQAFNNNFNSQRFNSNQQPAVVAAPAAPATEFNSQRFRSNQNFAFNKKPEATTLFVQDTTTTAPAFNYNNYQGRGNNYYQQPSTTAVPTYKPNYSPGNNNFYQNQPTTTTVAAPTNYKANYNFFQAQTTTTTTAAPTNYKTNYNQGNNYYQAQTTQAPQYNYNQQSSTPASTAYNTFQSRGSPQPTTNYNNNYQANTYQANNNYQPNSYNSPSTVNVNSNYDATTLKQNYFPTKQTTVNYDDYYKTSTVGYTSTFAPEAAQNYNYDNSASVYQQTKNQYNYNVNAAGTTYNPYSSYKASNDGYDEPSAGESLKTAPSSNIRPSDLNAIAKSYQKPSGFNASLTASYNFVNTETTQKPTSKYYNSPKQFQTTLKSQTTVRPFQQSPTTFQQPPGRGNAFFAQSTTAASPQPRPFSKAPEATVAPAAAAAAAVKKEKDASYDYAYYDEGTGSEYDGIDTVGEEFSRTTSHKHSRTTPQ